MIFLYSTSPPEDQLDSSNLSEADLYFLEDEAQLQQEEKATLLSNGFTSELPVPFIIVPGDEEENELTENDLRYRGDHEDFSAHTEENFEDSVSATNLNSVRRPINSEPGVNALTDHNYNNVMEHAYADTLFYK